MITVVEQTQEQKFKMYSKLSKKELIQMLIEANRHLNNKPIVYDLTEPLRTYAEICPCNPLNGGSGICGCTMANEIIK